MKPVHKVLMLPSGDRILLIRTALWLGVTRAGLKLLPFNRLRRLMSNLASARNTPSNAGKHSVERVIWSVELASRHLLAADTCLIQALTTQIMLGRMGYPTDIQIGVTRDHSGKFSAHAWVEREGEILIGGPGTNAYVPLYSWGGEAV